MGFNAPMTIAGWAAQVNAEILSGNVIAQLTRKGAPFIYAYGVPTMDLKTATVSYVSPEFLITNPLMAQLGRFYGFPTWSTAGASDSKILDTQALAQVSLSLYNCALSGINLVHDIGFLDIGVTASFELVAICDELISFLERALSGFEVTDETLALDVISKVGIGGHFLAEEHSRRHLKEYWNPSLLDRQGRKAWLEGGGKDLNKRARERVKEILEGHEVPPLPRDVQEELNNILKRAEAELLG